MNETTENVIDILISHKKKEFYGACPIYESQLKSEYIKFDFIEVSLRVTCLVHDLVQDNTRPTFYLLTIV